MSTLERARLADDVKAVSELPETATTLRVLSRHSRSALECIDRGVERLDGMVGDLLDLTRGRLGGGIPVAPETIDAGDLVRRVAEETGESHRIEIVVSGDSAVAWDRPRAFQLFANLVDNALRHSSAGEPVRVVVDGAEAAVAVSVQNGGDVIPDQLLNRIFHPFQRLEAPRRREGLGLGLFIASEVARAHGGTIDVRSSAEEGTCFTVRMPRAPDLRDPSATSPAH